LNSVQRNLKESNNSEPLEQTYQDEQPDLPVGPKTVEIPDMLDIPAKDLVSSLDFNLRLTILQ